MSPQERSDKRIPISAPDLTGNEERYVLEALRSSWISSTGPFVSRFERDFARVSGTAHVIGVSNGTVALHVALVALGVGLGDEVIVPALTYIATANAVAYQGAEPVFVDVSVDTWCLDPDRIEEAITSRTKGIIAVDLYGHPADMDRINTIAAAHGLWVLEDAAEAHKASYKGRPAGSLGTAATFSFYGNKIVTSGEGGAVTTDDADLAARIRILRGQGVDPERRYWFPVVGYNYRLTNLASAILCAQLERIDSIVARRLEITTRYRQALAGVAGIEMQPIAPWAQWAPWLFCMTINEQFGFERDELMSELDLAGVETRPFFYPLHELPPYAKASSERGTYLPVTTRLAATGLNLPTYPGLSDASVDRISNLIGELGARRR